MAINIVYCASDADRQAAVAVLQAAGKSVVSFATGDGLSTTATVAGNALNQTGVVSASFVVIGSAAS